MKQKIYLDHAATTPVRPEVVEAMLPYYREEYANPAAVYGFSTEARKAIDWSRMVIAKQIGALKEEIYFTGGGTESDNWAIVGIARAYRNRGRHIITSAIEHPAVRHTMQWLETEGFEVTYLPVDNEGMVSLERLQSAIRPDTILLSIMAANNEIGTIEPLEQIGALAKAKGVLFHTDAVQAFGQIPLDVEKMQIDLLSASAHKLGGPKGVGMLYVRKGVAIQPLMHGGGQERGLRPGTLNTPGIVGFGKAVELAAMGQKERIEKEIFLRDYLTKRIETEIPYAGLMGSRENRLPGHACFGIRFCEGEALVLLLDREGIYVSSGSACTMGSRESSHVLQALGLSEEQSKEGIRFTLSERNTKEEIDKTVHALKEAVKTLRAMTPQAMFGREE